MKKYIYPSLIGTLTFLSLLLFIQVVLQSSEITHYKKLYFETDKILEDHFFVDMHSDSAGGVVIVVHEKP